MELIVLGSGTSAPHLHRNPSSYVIKAGKHQFLFDSGAGTQRRLLEAKIDYNKFDYMFFTHLHNDHINDLPAFIWSYKYSGSPRMKKLNLIGPKGFRKYFKVLLQQILKCKTKFKIDIKEFGNSRLKIGNILVRSTAVIHSDNSVAYRIEHKGKAIVYSGDMDYTAKFIKFAKNADLLILECSNPDEDKYSGHLIPKECGEIATKAGAKVLMLTHFYPEADKADVKAQTKRKFKGKIIVAKDLMKVKI